MTDNGPIAKGEPFYKRSSKNQQQSGNSSKYMRKSGKAEEAMTLHYLSHEKTRTRQVMR